MVRLTVQLWLTKSAEAFDSAELLLSRGYRNSATSRAYYGVFYVATALLDARGESFSRHTRVISRFAVVFSQPGLMERRFHRLLLESFDARQAADYDVKIAPDEPAISVLIAEGRESLPAAHAYVDRA